VQSPQGSQAGLYAVDQAYEHVNGQANHHTHITTGKKLNISKQVLYGISVAIGLAASAPVAADSKSQVTDLLQQGLVAGDTAFIRENVAPDYIQHNPQAPDGLEGLLQFTAYLKTLAEPVAINTVRVLQEGDLVVAHSEYSLGGPKAVFDLFRVADGKLVEHWDAIQDIPAETVSGRTMTDGQTEITDLDKTAANKELVLGFVNDVLINGKGDTLTNYIGDVYMQHNPNVADGLDGLGEFIGYLQQNNISFAYKKIHNVVAEGNFVFTQSEGDFGGKATAFYDLFRVEDGLIVEHWDVVQEIPEKFAHDNGMF
jgi:predicted SnoaL-like aldol condensation-catalyzing enzyme